MLTKTEIKTNAKKILVVDDEKDLVVIVSKVLGRNGYQVMTATNGLECLEKVETEPPDLILLDNIMPNMDGRAALAKLKSSPKTAGIPVVMLTAVADEDYVSAAQKNGAADYVVKPFNYGGLLETIAQILESRHKKEDI